MHTLHDHWLRLFAWFIQDGASRATFCLVVITAWYAYLTWRMAKAMARQTRALVQPIVTLDIATDQFYPQGRFTVGNVGTQPFIVLDMRIVCRIEEVKKHQDFMMYERHILPPSDSVSFTFDFLKSYQEDGFTTFMGGGVVANIAVVVADLGEQNIQTYQMYTYWKTLTMKRGLPWRVRRKNWAAPFKQWYWRFRYKFWPPKPITLESPKPDAQTSAPRGEKASPQNADSPDGL
jgi:hypothetical protein